MVKFANLNLTFYTHFKLLFIKSAVFLKNLNLISLIIVSLIIYILNSRFFKNLSGYLFIDSLILFIFWIIRVHWLV